MKVTVSKEVRKSQAVLFHLSQNYMKRLKWDVYLSEAYLLDNASEAAIGIDSFCKSTSGTVMVSRYVSYKPPLVAAVSMVKGPTLLRSFSGSWRFKALGNESTLVTFTYNFKTRPTWLRWLIEPIVAYFYHRDMRRRLTAFKAWAESRP
ncbi:SRPBCC family protein [Chitinimonas sp. PSY-7]|uniref:SRPBCC family protein n=1 Tax=Chitinimonas sp. PSY-7 TaxID=3459088 RepID=UPI00404025D9